MKRSKPHLETLMRHVAWLAASALLTGCVVAPRAPHAQPHYPPGTSQRAPEVREVPTIAGRLSVAQGDVRIWRTDEDGSTDWDDADVNDVVTTHSQLRTGNDGRAEVRFGPHALRLDEHSELVFEQLDDHHTTVRLERGTLAVRLHNNEFKDTLTVQSGGRNVELRSPGRYRLEGSEGAPIRVTSFRGEAMVYAGGNSLSLREGRSLDISPDGGQLNYGEAVATAFDEWSLRRDERLRDTASTRYVSPYMTGYEDLDAHGDWVSDATYGTVWVPRVVVAGWAPYRHGRWRWVSPWGWTWVDEAPWGFAPFHYGRWVYVGTRWCWWPGAYVARPVYAPALVGWVGRPGWSVSVNVGSPGYVGWYPLAPWHAYQPRYISDVRYNASLNQGIINRPPAGVSINTNIERGGTAVPGRGFRDPIRRGGAPLDQVTPVRELQPVAPPARIVRSTGEQSPPRPQFDRDIRLPERQHGPAASIVQPQQPPQIQPLPQPQPRGNPLEPNPGRVQPPRAMPVPDPRGQPDAAGWRNGRVWRDRSEPEMTMPRPMQPQPQPQPQMQPQPVPQPQMPPRGNPLNQNPPLQAQPPARVMPPPQMQPQPQPQARPPQVQHPPQQQGQPDKDFRQRGDRGERGERGGERGVELRR
jgi:hypothetical protein